MRRRRLALLATALAAASVGCRSGGSGTPASPPALLPRVEHAIGRVGEPRTPQDLRGGIDELKSLPRNSGTWRVILPALYRYEVARPQRGVTLAVLSGLRRGLPELLPALADLFEPKEDAAQDMAAALLGAVNGEHAEQAAAVAAFADRRRLEGRPVPAAMVAAATVSYGEAFASRYAR